MKDDLTRGGRIAFWVVVVVAIWLMASGGPSVALGLAILCVGGLLVLGVEALRR